VLRGTATIGGAQPPAADRVRANARRARADTVESIAVAAIIFLTELVRSTTKLLTGDDGNTGPIAQVVFSAVYGFAGVRLWQMRGRFKASLARLVPLLVFLGITLASTAWSVDPLTTFKDAVELIGTTVIAIYLACRFTLTQFLNVLVYTYGAISGVSALLVVASPGRGRTDWGAGPWCGMFIEKNGLGLAMALAEVSLVPLMLQTRGRRRWLIAALLVLSLALLVGANSITALLICIAVAVLGAVAFALRARKYGLVGAILLATWMIGLVFAVVGFEQSQFFGVLGRNSNLTGRTEIWPGLFTAIYDRPLLGFGFNVFFEENGLFNQYLASFLDEFFWVPPHAHNSFIQIALDTGVLGLTSFIVVLVFGIGRAVRFFWVERSFVSIWPLAVILFLVLGSYDEVYFEQPNTLQWILFAAALLFPFRDAFARSSATAIAALEA
jgi:O-antigen ligase